MACNLGAAWFHAISRHMHTLGLALTGFVGLFHVYVFVLETFLWTTPLGMKTFRNTPERAEATKSFAVNQGVYNSFLAAGIFWGLASSAELALARLTFFLACVFVAGIVGGASVNKRIFFVQGLPALLALGALWLAR